jgi:hypothetical protein
MKGGYPGSESAMFASCFAFGKSQVRYCVDGYPGSESVISTLHWEVPGSILVAGYPGSESAISDLHSGGVQS